MRILMISLDQKILEEGSVAQARHFEYGKICDELHIVVLHANQPQSFDGAQRECESESTRKLSFSQQEKISEKIHSNVRIYGVKGKNKIFRLWDGYKKAKAIVESGKPHLASPSKGEETKFVVTTQDAGFTGLLGYLLKKNYGVKLNIQIHGQEEKLFNKILLFPFQKLIIRNADSIRVVSERLKNLVVGEYGVDTAKIYVISIYSEFAGKLRNLKFEIRNCESIKYFNILTVGRLVKVKNIKLQIEALAEVIKIFPNIRLVIVGDGHEKNNLQKIAKRLKVEDKVEFAGWQDNVADYYKKADLFLLTSNSEGWGMAAMEAMAAAVPVIMTDVGCAGEILKNEENSLIIPINDKKSLIAAICTMITDVEKKKDFQKMRN